MRERLPAANYPSTLIVPGPGPEIQHLLSFHQTYDTLLLVDLLPGIPSNQLKDWQEWPHILERVSSVENMTQYMEGLFKKNTQLGPFTHFVENMETQSDFKAMATFNFASGFRIIFCFGLDVCDLWKQDCLQEHIEQAVGVLYAGLALDPMPTDLNMAKKNPLPMPGFVKLLEKLYNLRYIYSDMRNFPGFDDILQNRIKSNKIYKKYRFLKLVSLHLELESQTMSNDPERYALKKERQIRNWKHRDKEERLYQKAMAKKKMPKKT